MRIDGGIHCSTARSVTGCFLGRVTTTVAALLILLAGSTMGDQRKPRQKEHRMPADSLLGYLPEGIGIPAGNQAPDAELRDFEDRVVPLRDLWAEGPILLVFYRGGWCPYCNFQIRELTDAYPEFAERGVTPVAVSVDRIEEAAQTQATYTIPFPVLVDPDLATHHAFRVAHHVDDAELQRLKGFGIDLEAASGQTHHTIAIPSLFLIDPKGIIRWAHADTDYTVRPSPAQILAAIDRSMAGTKPRRKD